MPKKTKKTTTKEKPPAPKKPPVIETENPYPNDPIPPLQLKNGTWVRMRPRPSDLEK